MMFRFKIFRLLSVILFSVFILPISSFGINDNDTTVEKIFFLIYNQQFDEAEKELILSHTKLDHLNYYVLNMDLLWWKAIIKNNENDFNILEKKLNTTIDELEKSSSRDNFKELVCLNYLFRLASMKDQPLKMIHYFLKINRIIEHFEKKGLDQEDIDVFNLYKAIYSYGKGKILFFNPRLREESLKTLRSYQFSPSSVNQTIANYFLAKIYKEVEKSPESAKPYYERLYKLYPNNKVFEKELFLCRNKIQIR